MLRAALIGALVWAVTIVAAASAHATFSREQVICRAAVARSAAKFAQRAANHTAKCHSRRDRHRSKASDRADCNTLAYGATERLGKVEAKLRSTIATRCSDRAGNQFDPTAMNYRECPGICGATIATIGDLTDCVVCLVTDSVEEMSDLTQGSPVIGRCNGGEYDGLPCYSCTGGAEPGTACNTAADCELDVCVEDLGAGDGNGDGLCNLDETCHCEQDPLLLCSATSATLCENVECTAGGKDGLACSKDDDCQAPGSSPPPSGSCHDSVCRLPCASNNAQTAKCHYTFCEGGSNDGGFCSAYGRCPDLGVCTPILERTLRSCRAVVGKKQAQHLGVLLKERVKCQAAEEFAGATDTDWCALVNPQNKVGKIRAKGERSVRRRCGSGQAPETPANCACETGSLDGYSGIDDADCLAYCVFEESDAAGSGLFETFYSLVVTCGDGYQAPDEECDDGNLIDGDGCDSNCTPTACGNAVVTAGEACDDGNLSDGDGCDSNCTLPATTTTTTLPASWTQVRQILEPSCSGCHGAVAIGPDNNLTGLHGADGGYQILVDGLSTCAGDPMLVTPGDPAASFLYNKVAGAAPACGVQMPMGLSLGSGQVETIRSWIAGGALDD